MRTRADTRLLSGDDVRPAASGAEKLSRLEKLWESMLPIRKFLRPVGKFFRYALPLPEWWFTQNNRIRWWVEKLQKIPRAAKIVLVPAMITLAIILIPVPGPLSAAINAVAAAIVSGMWGADWAARISMTFFVQPMVYVLKNAYNVLSWATNSIVNFFTGNFRLAKGPIYYPLVNRKGVHN